MEVNSPSLSANNDMLPHAHKRIAIAIVSYGIGGAEKRFLSLFLHLCGRSHVQAYLVINEALYDSFRFNSYLPTLENVIVLREPALLKKLRQMRNVQGVVSKLVTVLLRVNLTFRLKIALDRCRPEVVHGVLDAIPLCANISETLPTQ